jgi:homoserine O-acetyltransferase
MRRWARRTATRPGMIDNAVMVLHGTGGTGKQFLAPQFADELYGPGQPLDISRYYIILPDGIGHGRSSKPSDGLRMRFPNYDYDDMVEAQRLLLGRLGVARLRLLMGTSMGCMHGFVWAKAIRRFCARRCRWPACRSRLPAATGCGGGWRSKRSGAIPAWAEGNYAAEPVQGLRAAADLLQIAGMAPLYVQHAYPTREAADAMDRAARRGRDLATRDANDLIYQLEASRTYDPLPGIDRIRTPMTWVNSADDFINPPELGIAEPAARRMPSVRYVLIPASPETRGHGTHTWARFWKGELADLLRRTER